MHIQFDFALEILVNLSSATDDARGRHVRKLSFMKKFRGLPLQQGDPALENEREIHK
jgi:hypothetical protein